MSKRRWGRRQRRAFRDARGQIAEDFFKNLAEDMSDETLQRLSNTAKIKSIKKIFTINFWMSASVFMDAYILMRGQLPFDFYFYYLIYALVVFKYIKKNKDLKLLPKWFFITLVAIIAVSYATGINYNTSGFTMHKQVIGIVFSSLSLSIFTIFSGVILNSIGRMHARQMSMITKILGNTSALSVSPRIDGAGGNLPAS